MHKNEGQAPIERVVTERRKKKKSIGRSEETRYCVREQGLQGECWEVAEQPSEGKKEA